MHFQPGLLRLPIPKLDDTCARYLAALQPVAPSPEAFTRTQELVQDFQRSGGLGQGMKAMVCACSKDCSILNAVLQGKLILENRANKHTSYISKPWFNMYLSDKKSLVLNYNPFMAFKEDAATRDQVCSHYHKART